MQRQVLYILILLSFIAIESAWAQNIVRPVINSKTHPSLRIDSITLHSEESICYLTVTNENTEGSAWFCADENIILREQENGKEHKLIRSEHIPVCPESHRFTQTGEELHFILYFPALQNKLSEIDIVEQCANNCFTLQGIVLDPVLNQEIRSFEQAVLLYNQEKKESALSLFLALLGSDYKQENHFAYSHYIIPLIYLETGQEEKAKESYTKLKNSNILQKNYFLGKLREFDFFLDLE